MTAERILQSDVLDILFEDRNKSYGAYELRRTYPSRIKRAVGSMFFLIAIASAGYLFGSERDKSINVDTEYLDSGMLVDIKPVEKPKEVELSKPITRQDVATVKNNIPVITPDEKVIKTEVPPMEMVDTSAYGDETKPGEAVTAGQNVTNGEPGAATGDGESTKPAAPESVMPSGPIDMHQADEMPVYPGGTQALVRFMMNNLTSELEPGVKYVLKAQFVVDETGQISEANILSSDDATLNNQVLKALRKMKQWKPGKYHGHNVAVRFTMPVTFMGGDE